MPTLVNFNGNDESYVENHCSSRKRARINQGYSFEEKNKTSIENLPNECLFEILRRIKGDKERRDTALVSKRWLMLLSNIRNSETTNDKEMDCEGCFKRTLKGEKATDVRLAAISVGTCVRGGLGKLSILGSNKVTNLGLSAIAHSSPYLRKLLLWNLPLISDEGLYEIARECPKLEKLDLCHCPLITDEGIVAIAKNCPNLTWINFESCSNIGNQGLEAIGKYCQKLQSLTIRNCPLVTDQGIHGVISTNSSPNLSKLKLLGLNITDISLALIGQYGKGITSLVLAGLQNVTEKGFWVLGYANGLTKLVSLSIILCKGTTNVSLESIGKGCPNLKHMHLRRCSFVHDTGLLGFTKSAQCLESLHLVECNKITQTGILNAISNGNLMIKSLSVIKCMGINDLSSNDCSVNLFPSKTLESLTIKDCPGFGSKSLAMIGKLCPMISYLDLSGQKEITDASLLTLLDNSEAGLVNVNLSKCVNLTDEVVTVLADRHSETLQILSLESCKNVTDIGVISLAEDCWALNHLDVSKCSITDSSITALSCGVQENLQMLILSGCSMVTDKSFLSLMNLGKTLLALCIQQCDSISSDTIDKLFDELWSCNILS